MGLSHLDLLNLHCSMCKLQRNRCSRFVDADLEDGFEWNQTIHEIYYFCLELK